MTPNDIAGLIIFLAILLGIYYIHYNFYILPKREEENKRAKKS